MSANYAALKKSPYYAREAYSAVRSWIADGLMILSERFGKSLPRLTDFQRCLTAEDYGRLAR